MIWDFNRKRKVQCSISVVVDKWNWIDRWTTVSEMFAFAVFRLRSLKSCGQMQSNRDWFWCWRWTSVNIFLYAVEYKSKKCQLFQCCICFDLIKASFRLINHGTGRDSGRQFTPSPSSFSVFLPFPQFVSCFPFNSHRPLDPFCQTPPIISFIFTLS